jgi:hypothetical protein
MPTGEVVRPLGTRRGHRTPLRPEFPARCPAEAVTEAQHLGLAGDPNGA